MEALGIFRAFDSNSDGSLEMTELSTGLSDSGLTDYQIEALFFALDANAGGKEIDATRLRADAFRYARARLAALEDELLG